MQLNSLEVALNHNKTIMILEALIAKAGVAVLSDFAVKRGK